MSGTLIVAPDKKGSPVRANSKRILDNKRLNQVYGYAPGILRDAMATTYGWLMARKRYGKYFQQYLNEFSETQWFSREQIVEIQNRRLRRLVEHAAAHVPYYRQLFCNLRLSPQDIADQTQLAKLPILEKETFRQQNCLFRSSIYGEKDVVHNTTGGTTGKSLDIALSLERFQAEQAIKWFHYSWSGIKKGDKIATLAGHAVAPVEQTHPPFWVTNYVDNQVLFSPNHLSKRYLGYYAQKLAEMQPALMHGYPWTMYLLAQYIRKTGCAQVHPRVIYTSSETLFNHQRQVIEQQFGCKVYDYYANGEMVANILECPDSGLHVIGSHSIVEFLRPDGTPAAPGEEAELICTDLIDYASPLIRYRIGDTAVLSDKRCTCGRPSILVDQISGRIKDAIITPDGRYRPPLSLVFKHVDTIVEAQIVQTSREQLIIRIVKDTRYTDADTQKLLHDFRRMAGPDMRIDFEFLDAIPRSAKGKFRPILSYLPRQLEGDDLPPEE